MIQYDPHRWLDHLFDVKGSLIREIALRVLSCLTWALGVVAYDHYVRDVAIPPTVHTLVGVALGMLLVFRTNASYNRFWEGRQLWGSLINEARNLARGASVHLRGDPELLDHVIRWTGTFPYAVKNVLRGTDGLGPIADTLPRAELEWVLRSDHPPLSIATRITARLVKARDKGLISDITLASLDRNVQLLVDYLGGCERINSTPLPFAYMVHLRRVIIMYCFTLPFALVGTFGWVTVAATLGVAYTLFGIEEIGVEIENPFGHDANDLALEDLCAKIAKNLLALTGRHDEADAHAIETGEVIKIGVE
jgi:ion channel-forming bestrophin family protein